MLPNIRAGVSYGRSKSSSQCISLRGKPGIGKQHADGDTMVTGMNALVFSRVLLFGGVALSFPLAAVAVFHFGTDRDATADVLSLVYALGIAVALTTSFWPLRCTRPIGETKAVLGAPQLDITSGTAQFGVYDEPDGLPGSVSPRLKRQLECLRPHAPIAERNALAERLMIGHIFWAISLVGIRS
jgi:hypothetical protein